MCAIYGQQQNPAKTGGEEREVRSLDQSVSQRFNGLNGWIDGLSNRQIALYKCTSANPTKKDSSNNEYSKSRETPTVSHCIPIL